MALPHAAVDQTAGESLPLKAHRPINVGRGGTPSFNITIKISGVFISATYGCLSPQPSPPSSKIMDLSY